MKLSVVIPAHNAAEFLSQCLSALAASTRPADEIIVVDDASTDGSGAIAQAAGVRVISLTGVARGPALARNRGAAAATGEALVFLDADVAVHPYTLARIENYFSAHLEIAAVFGSYDDAPPALGWVTRYKNLLHHYVHQHSAREASTFWAGCGAIRRVAFEAMRGFDESFRNASIEDIELGLRMKRAGLTTWLCKDIQVTHLKRWTFTRLLRADIFDRAVPWTRLIAREQNLPQDLNLNWISRASAALVWVVLAALVAAFFDARAEWLALGALIPVAVMNRDLYFFFAQRGGFFFACGAMVLHWLYFLYSSGVFGGIILANRFQKIWRISQKVGTPRHAIWLLLGLTLLKGLTWSIIVPPWHAPDEPQHFLYGQSIERQQTLWISPSNLAPREALILFDLIQFNSVRYKSAIFDFSDRAGIAAQIAQLDDENVKRTPLNGEGRVIRVANFTSQHPPFYYLISGILQRALEDRSILVRLLFNRWLSVALGCITVLLAYLAGKELWPESSAWAVFVATLTSFQPMATFINASVANGAMEMTLVSACLFVALRIIRLGLTWLRAICLGAAIGLGILTKISFVGVLPLIGLLFIWHLTQRPFRSNWLKLLPWGAAAFLSIALGGWWIQEAMSRPGMGLVFSALDPKLNVMIVLADSFNSWLNNYRALLYMYWGNFGWLNTPLPDLVNGLVENISAVSVWSAGWWLIQRFVDRRQPIRNNNLFAVLLLGSATFGVTLFYAYLDFRVRVEYGGTFGMQGRYFLPPIAGQMVWLAIGLVAPAPPRLRRAWIWLIAVSMIALNLFSLFDVIALRYYGARNLLLVVDRATVLQPVPASALFVLIAIYFTTLALFVPIFWRALRQESLPAL